MISMAEGTIYQFVGSAEAPKPTFTKPDTLQHKHMQEVFDIVAPHALEERIDARNAETEIALLTAQTLTEKKYIWEKRREIPHKLERILLFSVLGGASALMDFGGDELTSRLLKKEGSLFTWKNKQYVSLENQGNREALKAGWEMITDSLIGKFSDLSVQQATNRGDVKFVSPLSDTLSKVGNIAISFTLAPEAKRMHRFINSMVNPSTIEAGFRTLSAIPIGGHIVENVYAAANQFLLKEKGLFPYGFDLAATMLAAKAKYVKPHE